MSAPLSVTAVVLSWNGRERTLACLRSLARATYRPLSVIVVDNGSDDGTVAAVADAFPDVTLVPLDQNLGFAGGMNVGITAAVGAGADAVVLLNNDMEVDPGFIEPLVEAVRDDGRCGAACSQILFTGEPPRIWYAGASFNPRRGHSGRHVGYGQPPLPPTTAPYSTDRACGGAMLFTASRLRARGALRRESVCVRGGHRLVAPRTAGGAPLARRAGEHRSSRRVCILGRRIVADLDLLLAAKLPRRRREVGASRCRRDMVATGRGGRRVRGSGASLRPES